jgi:pimeloyl-ACP methyl ester carboxylesterase
VLLHGLGRRWQVFLPIIPALSLRWHIFAPDLRGHGRSSHVARGYHGPQFSDDITRLLRERVGGPAVLFGHSLGGMLAMSVAATRHELVKALVLGDNMIVARDFRHPLYTALFSGLRDVSRGGGSVEHIATQIGKIVLPVPGTAESLAIRDPETYEMTLDGSSLEGWDGEAVLGAITCPTLLLQGATQMGGLMSDADVAIAIRLLAHHAHVKFKNLGHALFIQQPEPVLRAVTNFLESL